MRPLLCLFTAIIILVGPCRASAEKRVALVIGNGKYTYAGTLANPVNDAADMAAALRGTGFTVISGFDLDKPALEKKIREFASALASADTGVFFYAGHGLQVAGTNYLVPVDAELSTADALEFEMVKLDAVQRVMESAAKTNILFLDACRNNPLARNLARALGTRGSVIGKGLAPAESGVGTLISFSTQPGNVAQDGSGHNSVYTGPLVRWIATPGEDILSVLTAVRNEVLAATNEQQVPWENHALRAKFYFNRQGEPSPKAQPSADSVLLMSEAGRVWDRIKDSRNPEVFKAFRDQFGGLNPAYDTLAADREKELRLLAVAQPAAQDDDAIRQCELLADAPLANNQLTADAALDQIDTARAIPICRQAFALSHESPRFAYILGRAFHKDGDDFRAREMFEKAAAKGNPRAMLHLGILYSEGKSFPKDYVKVREWYEKAASYGDIEAMHNLGNQYAAGKGGEQDYRRARELYERAIAGGNLHAAYNLGNLYLAGNGAPRDAVKARELFARAAKYGNVNSMISLANLQAAGKGGVKDVASARNWLKKAKELGSAAAAARLRELETQ